MRRVLFDQNTPAGLRRFLPHDISHGLPNGLVDASKRHAAAEHAGFTVMVTCDQSMRYQQNMTGLLLGLVVLSTNRLRILSEHAGMVAHGIGRVGQGAREVVTLPRPPRQRRPFTPSP